jgi:hypothetical protein
MLYKRIVYSVFLHGWHWDGKCCIFYEFYFSQLTWSVRFSIFLWQRCCGPLWTAVYCGRWVTDIVLLNTGMLTSLAAAVWGHEYSEHKSPWLLVRWRMAPSVRVRNISFFVLLGPTICFGVCVVSWDVNSRKPKSWVSVIAIGIPTQLETFQLLKKKYSSSSTNIFLRSMNNVFSYCLLKAGV